MDIRFHRKHMSAFDLRLTIFPIDGYAEGVVLKIRKQKRLELLLICLLPLFFLGCKTSGSSYSYYPQESYITPGRHVIKSAGGNVQGYLQQSKIDRRRTVQYDKKGNEVGYWQKSPIDSRKTVFHKK